MSVKHVSRIINSTINNAMNVMIIVLLENVIMTLDIVLNVLRDGIHLTKQAEYAQNVIQIVLRENAQQQMDDVRNARMTIMSIQMI